MTITRVAFACLALTLVAGCGGGSSAHDLRGGIVVNGDCDSSGYDDIDAGAQVVVRDGDHKTLATGNLTSTDDICIYKFKVKDLPEAKFYGIEVSHRGEVVYSLAKLEKRNWQVVLSLG